LGLRRALLRGGAGHRDDAGPLALAARRPADWERTRPLHRHRHRGLRPRQPSHPPLGGGPILRAGDVVHALPAALLPPQGPGQARPPRSRGSDPGARAAPRRRLRTPPGGELHYPRAPLRCEPLEPLLNVLLIVIDAMRADSLAPDTAPHMAAFAQD